MATNNARGELSRPLARYRERILGPGRPRAFGGADNPLKPQINQPRRRGRLLVGSRIREKRDRSTHGGRPLPAKTTTPSAITSKPGPKNPPA